jgi:cytochrome c553
MNKTKLITTLACIFFAVMSLSSIAAEVALDGATLYMTKTCFACHGKDANTPLQPNYPKLVGQSKDYALAQMQDIKSGARNNGQTSAMKGVMGLVNDAEMAAIAEWLSNLPEKIAKKEKTAKKVVTLTPAKSVTLKAVKKDELPAGTCNVENVAPPKGWDIDAGEIPEALKLTPDLENGMDVYEICAACHLPEGWGREDGTFPQLAGQHRRVLIKQLADIRALNRDNPTMYPFTLKRAIGGAQSVSDVTAYIAQKLLMNPNNGVGSGDDLEYGKQLYKENCVKCHCENGQGSAKNFYPRIQAQHYKYMLRQFEWIRDGKRRNANPDMVKQIQEFTDRDMKAVIDYASRLKPPQKLVAPRGWSPIVDDDDE